jgi:hypothetical protein
MMTPQDIAFDVYDVLVTASENVYDERPPKALPNNHNDFIVFIVRNFNPMYDYDSGSIFQAAVFVECYIKNKANGIKNTAKIKEITDLVMTSMSGSTTFRASLSEIRPDSKQINDYHAQVLIFNIIKS